MSEHALLSASGAHRWLHCTPSARLEATLPEKTSEYADEGRLAHEIAELKMRKHFIEPMGPRTFSNRLKKLRDNPLYREEMMKYTDTYKDYVAGIVHGFASTPYIAIEKRLDYSNCVPEGFGTGDCIVIGGNTLYVIDFKYGKGVPVSAEDNVQMKLYALGAVAEYSFIYPIEKVVLVISQPRLSEAPSEWVISIQDLSAWGDSIRPIAQAAYAGTGEFVSGDHCQFCRVKGRCRAQSEFNTSLEEFEMKKPPLLTNEEVGAILERARNLAKWVSDLEEYALGECLAGRSVPGWKAVEGRSNRKFTDQNAAFKAITDAGYEEAVLYTREPLGLTAVETLLGKAKFKDLVSPYVDKPPGKPALAGGSDKREAIKPRSAEDDFKDSAVENDSVLEGINLAELLEDLKKYHGLPPYDDDFNFVKLHPNFAESIKSRYTDEQIEAGQKILGII